MGGSEPVDVHREGVMARITFTESSAGRWRVTRAEAIPTWTQISPAIRLIDLPSALADPATTDAQRRVYQAAYDRVRRYAMSLGAAGDGLIVIRPGR